MMLRKVQVPRILCQSLWRGFATDKLNAQTERQEFTTLEQVCCEGQLFKPVMKEEWESLCDDIRYRFDRKPPGMQKPLKYKGLLGEVDCNLVGKIISNFTRPTRCLLPYTGKNIPIYIEVFTKNNRTEEIFKKREYSFPGKKPWVFESSMRLGENGELLELIQYGLGMELHPSPKEGNLQIFSGKYFLNLPFFGIVYFPHFLTPGTMKLLHSNIDKHRFHVKIEIFHPIFGRTFIMDGDFEEILDDN